jgi:uncharacterized protein (TIGR02147 family)
MLTKREPIDLERDYRRVLKDEFSRRCETNGRYTMRAFARDLGVAASTLSETLGGRHHLSQASARRIAAKLGLDEREAALFVEMVALKTGRSALRRNLAANRLDAVANDGNEPLLKEDVFALVAEWYHLAILELTKLPGNSSDPGWVARCLGITRETAAEALVRLIRLELLEERDGKLIAKLTRSQSLNDVPSPAIRGFHRGILAKASDALESQSVEEREFQSIVMAIEADALPTFKARIRDFTTKTKDLAAACTRKDKVYVLSIQMFRLAENAPHAH